MKSIVLVFFFLSYAGMILMLESNWGIDSRLVIFKSHVWDRVKFINTDEMF